MFTNVWCHDNDKHGTQPSLVRWKWWRDKFIKKETSKLRLQGQKLKNWKGVKVYWTKGKLGTKVQREKRLSHIPSDSNFKHSKIVHFKLPLFILNVFYKLPLTSLLFQLGNLGYIKRLSYWMPDIRAFIGN